MVEIGGRCLMSKPIDHGYELVKGDNEYRDVKNVLRFKIPQLYMLPINTPDEKNGSVSYVRICVQKDTKILQFYRDCRKFLAAYKIPLVQYCYEANLPELLCAGLPEVK